MDSYLFLKRTHGWAGALLDGGCPHGALTERATAML